MINDPTMMNIVNTYMHLILIYEICNMFYNDFSQLPLVSESTNKGPTDKG